jgi:hypothetical protein
MHHLVERRAGLIMASQSMFDAHQRALYWATCPIFWLPLWYSGCCCPPSKRLQSQHEMLTRDVAQNCWRMPHTRRWWDRRSQCFFS